MWPKAQQRSEIPTKLHYFGEIAVQSMITVVILVRTCVLCVYSVGALTVHSWMARKIHNWIAV